MADHKNLTHDYISHKRCDVTKIRNILSFTSFRKSDSQICLILMPVNFFKFVNVYHPKIFRLSLTEQFIGKCNGRYSLLPANYNKFDAEKCQAFLFGVITKSERKKRIQIRVIELKTLSCIFREKE